VPSGEAVNVVPPQEGLNLLLGKQTFPVPELIPPSIVRRRAVGAAKRRVGLAVIGLVGLLLLLLGLGRMQLSQANAQLSTAQENLRAAEAAKAQYDNVPTVYAAVDAARAELSQAMGNEVQVARIITELAQIIPLDVSLTTVSLVAGGEEEQGTGISAQEAIEPLTGSMSFAGEARTFDDVSVWIETLRGQPDYQNVILTEVSRDLTSGIYTFSNTAELTEQALSGRYVEETQ
jgi:Tfp pilus assembly protein PilN